MQTKNQSMSYLLYFESMVKVKTFGYLITIVIGLPLIYNVQKVENSRNIKGYSEKIVCSKMLVAYHQQHISQNLINVDFVY